jgi:hypothetical protein
MECPPALCARQIGARRRMDIWHLAAAGRQANEAGSIPRRASRIWYRFVQSRASRAEAWSTRFRCMRQ